MSLQAWHVVALVASVTVVAAVCLLIRATIRGYRQGRAEAAAAHERDRDALS